jgi:hypothetical protein
MTLFCMFGEREPPFDSQARAAGRAGAHAILEINVIGGGAFHLLGQNLAKYI